MIGTLLTITTIGCTALGGYNFARFAVGRVKLRKKQLAEAKELYDKLDRALEFAQGAYLKVHEVYDVVQKDGLTPYAAQLRSAKAAIDKALANVEQPSV